MISNSNKKILLIVIIILVVIVVLGIIGYLVYSKKTEAFKTLDNYVPMNQGEPLSNNLKDDVIIKAQNPVYNLDSNHQIINLISNIAGTKIFASCNDSANGNNLAICAYDISENKWSCLQFDKGSKLNPTTTLPEMINNISCSKDSSVLMAFNSHTLFIYNEPYNLLKRLNCLYYTSVSGDSLNCLALPTLNVPSTTSSSDNRPSLSYDKMNFICANDRVLLGLSCSNKLYYVLLDNTTSAPNSNSSWSGIDIMLPNIPNFNFKNINYLCMNDYSVFMYYNDYNNNATLLYSPLNIADGVLTLSLAILSVNQNISSTPGTPSTTVAAIIKPNFYSNGFAINNDVIFGLEKPDNSGNMNLWWCSLNNGLPLSTPSWKNMNLGNQRVASLPFNNLTAINIFNNSLIINYRTSGQNNLVIPLLSNSSNSTTSTTPNTTPNNTNQITTSTSPQSTNANTANATTTTRMASGSNSTTIPNTTSSTMPNGSNTNNTTTTSSNTISNTTPDTTPGTTLNTTTTSSNTNPLNKNNNTNGSAPSGLWNDLGAAAQNGIRTDVGVAGVNGNLGNKDNINDFMKDANLLGNNIYVSPMNNDQLYNPQAKLSQLGKITSSFFPMIKIAQ